MTSSIASPDLIRPLENFFKVSIFVLKFEVNCFKNVTDERAYPLEGER
jgi:hypothetical protein